MFWIHLSEISKNTNSDDRRRLPVLLLQSHFTLSACAGLPDFPHLSCAPCKRCFRLPVPVFSVYEPFSIVSPQKEEGEGSSGDSDDDEVSSNADELPDWLAELSDDLEVNIICMGQKSTFFCREKPFLL